MLLSHFTYFMTGLLIYANMSTSDKKSLKRSDTQVAVGAPGPLVKDSQQTFNFTISY